MRLKVAETTELENSEEGKKTAIVDLEGRMSELINSELI